VPLPTSSANGTTATAAGAAAGNKGHIHRGERGDRLPGPGEATQGKATQGKATQGNASVMEAALLPLETTESRDIAAELPDLSELPELPPLQSALTGRLGPATPVTHIGREDVSPAVPSPPPSVPVPRRRLPELHGVSGRLQP
jgi:hypothetical protein